MIKSAGIIVIDNEFQLEEPTVLCVRAYANWDFPKGIVEPGETLVAAAIRETEEETTLSTADFSLTGITAGPIIYGSGKKQKEVTYFLADRISNTKPFLPVSEELGKPENDEYRWVPTSQLHDLMPARLQSIVELTKGWVESINVERKS